MLELIRGVKNGLSRIGFPLPDIVIPPAALQETPGHHPVIEQGLIAETPYFIVDGHLDAFYPWYMSGITGATLLHIDEHSDSCPYTPEGRLGKLIAAHVATETEIIQYTRMLTNASFIAPAMACGIIERVFWLQPSTRSVYTDESCLDIQETGSLVATHQAKPLILDVDLDAFSYCFPTPTKYSWTFTTRKFGTEQKIQFAMIVLKKLCRPDIITIARSQTPRYVPADEVDFLQQRLLAELVRLYQ